MFDQGAGLGSQFSPSSGCCGRRCIVGGGEGMAYCCNGGTSGSGDGVTRLWGGVSVDLVAS